MATLEEKKALLKQLLQQQQAAPAPEPQQQAAPAQQVPAQEAPVQEGATAFSAPSTFNKRLFLKAALQKKENAKDVSVADDIGQGEALLISTGKGMNDIITGAQQRFFELTGQEEKAAEISKRVTEERKLFQPLKDKFPFTTLGGEILGGAALTPIPGLGTGSVLIRLAKGAAAGGLFGGMMATGEGESATQNAILGTLFGVGMTGFSEGAQRIIRKIVNANKGVFKGDNVKELLDLADKFDIPIFADDISSSPFLRFASRAADEIPVAGTAGGRIVQNDAQKAAAVRFVTEIKRRTVNYMSDDTVDEFLQKNLVGVMKTKRDAISAKFAKATQNVPAQTEVPLRATADAVDTLISVEVKAGNQGDQALIKFLTGIQSDLKNTEILKNLEFVSQRLRKNIGDEISNSYKGKDLAVGTASAAKLQQLKELVVGDQTSFLKLVDPKGATLFTSAMRDKARFNVTFKDTQLKNLVRTQEPEQIMAWLLGSNKASPGGLVSRGSLLLKNLDIDGRNVVRSTLAADALERSFNKSGVFDSRVFVKEFDKISGLTGVIFKATDRAELVGLVRILEITQRASDLAAGRGSSNILGRRIITPQVGPTAGGAGVAVGATLVAGMSGLIQTAAGIGAIAGSIKVVLQTKAGRNLLLAASKTKDPDKIRIIGNQLASIVARLETEAVAD